MEQPAIQGAHEGRIIDKQGLILSRSQDFRRDRLQSQAVLDLGNPDGLFGATGIATKESLVQLLDLNAQRLRRTSDTVHDRAQRSAMVEQADPAAGVMRVVEV